MIKLLDCTLRDGGYVNDWRFGKDAIVDIKENLELSGIDIIELGFIRNEKEDKNRTVFNSMKQVKKLLDGKKLPNIQYAVMAEVSNPYPLEMLEPYDEESPEIIRVIVWKRMLKEGFEYCKGIVEKGYKLCVQPARVSQYSDEEFIDMIKMFNELNPMAIYVVDSWGTMYKDELLHYLKLADENLKEGVSVGYHGHNNMMQAFDVAEAFCEQNLKRDLIIDASVYGIGRGAGNLNTEIFAKWANEKLGKIYNMDPIIDIYSGYIQWIYDHCEKWGYSIPYLITAKYNANPNFASYYEKCKAPYYMIEKCISSMSSEERIIFDDKKAMNALRQANKNKWNKTLGIIIVTANRPNAVKGNLTAIAEDCYYFGVDIIVYDSSNNDETKDITEKFAQKYDNIFYDRWDGTYDAVSIDNKVLDAYKKYSQKYEYIWQTRDGVAISAKDVLPQIKRLTEEKKDVIIIDQDIRDFKHHGSKNYTDAPLLFKEQCAHLNTLGTFIVRNEFIQDVIQQIPLDDKTYGLYCPIAFYHYWSKNKVNVASWVGNLWKPMEGIAHSSFWTKKILYQWGERWYDMISNLPSIYDEYKKEVLLIETFDFKPFTLKYLIKAKKYGGLSVSLVNKYKKYIKNVSRTPLWKFYAIAILPRFISKKISKMLERTDTLYNYNLPKKNNVKRKIMNYEQNCNCFELTKDVKSNLLYGSQDNVKNPYITVFIPAYKRLNLLKEAIDSVLKQQDVDFEWNIIIVDNEPYNGVANATEKYIRKLNNNKITYYRNDENLGFEGNFNRGFTLAKAPWIVVLHDDDLLLPNALSKIGKTIEYLNANETKELGAISILSHQFAYNPEKPAGCLDELNYWTNVYISRQMSYQFYKMTHSNVLLNGNIGGADPTCGAVYNKKAVLEMGGINKYYGDIANSVLYYRLENKYSVYSAYEPCGFKRQIIGEIPEKEITYNTIKDNFNFREYVFSKNLFNRVYGWLFRDSLYYAFTKVVLNVRRSVTADYASFYDYADIYNKKPGLISYTLYKLVIQKIYNIRKRVQTKMIRKKIKKYVKNKNKKELNNAANK